MKVNELISILKVCSLDDDVFLYNLDNGQRIVIELDDVDVTCNGLVDINFEP